MHSVDLSSCSGSFESRLDCGCVLVEHKMSLYRGLFYSHVVHKFQLGVVLLNLHMCICFFLWVLRITSALLTMLRKEWRTGLWFSAICCFAQIVIPYHDPSSARTSLSCSSLELLISGTWDSQRQILPVKTEVKKTLSTLSFSMFFVTIYTALIQQWALIFLGLPFVGDIPVEVLDGFHVTYHIKL